ncbi:MAG: hypothetical protein QG604_746 [Candidatus Dependentiae bacterium]|nr:hypothetical protein [Candidatus Dependentiae bacterium]
MHRAQTGFLKTLLHKWYASIDLFEPKELTMLSLASLNTLVRSSSLLLCYFSWWLLLWTGYVDLYIDGTGLFSHFWEYFTPMYYGIGAAPRIYLCSLMIVSFVMMLSVRSSLEAKTAGYFIRYSARLPFYALLFFVVPQIYTIPVFWLISFFLFDAQYSLKSFFYSIYNGLILNLMYAPFLLCVGAAHGLLFELHALIWNLTPLDEHYFVPYATKYGVSMILYLFFVAMLHTFYVRVVQSDSTSKWFWRVR